VASSGSEAPLVGLTTYVERSRHGSWDEVSALLPMTYVNATIRSGGVPILLPPSPAEPPAVLSVLDALVVTGGPDVDPARYGADSHPETDTPRPERDEWESALCLEAIAMDLPLLAVCRGLQVMNVALGGSLHQHLPELTGDESHRRVKGQMSPNRIHVDKGTSLATILGTEPEGWCHHHQAIDRLGRDLTVVARAGDETVEAVELAGRTFALGVQWHPESNADDDRLFESLVRAATDYRKRRAA
jgi:gamma-glutamyl-gamma-aminobutyrate hydrolase PuuD